MTTGESGAITFSIRFQTAQFKEHTQKLTRRTYLIPPPSAIVGLFGAILGIQSHDLRRISENLFAGAELLELGGRSVSIARTFKIDRPAGALIRLLEEYYGFSKKWSKERVAVAKDISGLLPLKESEELYMVKYKFAVASTDKNLITQGFNKLKELDFEYDIFGGNDYHFVDFIGEVKHASLEKSRIGRGYCALEDFESVETSNFRIMSGVDEHFKPLPMVIPAMFLADVKKPFVMVYGADIRAKKELEIVNDGESKIFVHKAAPFVVSWEHVL